MWYTINCSNIYTMGVPEGEERNKGVEKNTYLNNEWQKKKKIKEKHQSAHPRSSMNSKQDKQENIQTKINNSKKMLKSKDKKILKT